MRHFKCALCGVLAALLGIFPMAAQQSTQLEVKNSVIIPSMNAYDFILPVLDDEDGNIYVRYSDGKTDYAPIVRLSPTGDRTAQFALPSRFSESGARIADFCVSGRELLALVKSPSPTESSYLLSFGPAATLQSVIATPSDIDAFYLAAFRTGDIVLGGRVPRKGKALSANSVPALGLLNANGSVFRSIMLPGGDVAPTARRTFPIGAAKTDEAFEGAIQGSIMKSGDDGNIYLARRGRSGVVFVISPGGEATRRLVLEIPSDSHLTQMRVRNGNIAAVLLRKLSTTDQNIAGTSIRTYDAQTGKLIGSYELGAALKGALLAGFDGATGFTFVQGDGNGGLALIHTDVR